MSENSNNLQQIPWLTIGLDVIKINQPTVDSKVLTVSRVAVIEY